jgi:hypothetical protein
MPLTKSGDDVLANMKREYGEKRGKEIFYASINKGKKGSEKWHQAKHRQEGGLVEPGKKYIVGEKGAEAYVPRTAMDIAKRRPHSREAEARAEDPQEFSQQVMRGEWGELPKIKPRQSGGPVDPEKQYMVGEKGPELFVPKIPGTIVPHAKIKKRKRRAGMHAPGVRKMGKGLRMPRMKGLRTLGMGGGF